MVGYFAMGFGAVVGGIAWAVFPSIGFEGFVGVGVMASLIGMALGANLIDQSRGSRGAPRRQ